MFADQNAHLTGPDVLVPAAEKRATSVQTVMQRPARHLQRATEHAGDVKQKAAAQVSLLHQRAMQGQAHNKKPFMCVPCCILL